MERDESCDELINIFLRTGLGLIEFAVMRHFSVDIMVNL